MTTPQPAALPELSRGQIIDLISPLSNNSADHDIEFAHRVIAALQPQPAAETALQKFVRLKVADEVRSPLEQLRSFCSFAMSGQDWIDCEPFFDAIVESAQPAAAGVSDADVWELWLRVCAESDNVSTRVMIANFARAILALRPQAVPMTDEQIRSMCKQWWVFETVKQWVRVIEDHHGITAPADGEAKV